MSAGPSADPPSGPLAPSAWGLPPIRDLAPPVDELELVAGAGIWDWDMRRQRLYRSPGWEALYGVPVASDDEPFVIEQWVHSLHPDERERSRAQLTDLLDGDGRVWRHQFRVVRADGSARILRSVAILHRDGAGKPVRMVGVDRDVTAEVESAAALQASQERYALAMEVTREVIFDWDIVADTMHHTARAEEVYGFRPGTSSETIERFLSLVHPDDLDRFQRAIEGHLRDGTRFDVVYRFRHPEGELRWLRSRGEALRDDSGTAVRMVGAVADVTEESQLRRMWQVTETAARIGGWEIDLASRQLFLSPGVYHLLERPVVVGPPSVEDAIGYCAAGRSRARASELFRAALAHGEPFEGELDIVTDAGRRLRVHIVAEVECEDGRPVRMSGSLQDVTQRRDLEEQLLHAQKLESVGRLAGGIAHDFNNLLTVITAAASVVPTTDPAVAHEIAMIRDATRRAADLTRQLLTFARREEANPEPLCLGELVESAGHLLRKALGEAVRLEVEVPPGRVPIHADPGQIEQVLMNLAVNARDAMPTGGRLHIRVSEVSLPEADRARDLPPGRYARLEVIDDGTGVPEELRERVFEPFFTTKPVGEGSGLGLATCYGIVNRAGGRIDLESVAPRGTRAIALLPRVEVAVDARRPAEAGGNRGPQGCTLMVAEDEELVRDVMVRALQPGGNVVLSVCGPEEALALADTLDVAPDALVSDVVMPGGTGVELARSLRRRWPDLPVLLVSGYNEEVRPEFLEDGRTRFLAKPFGPARLREMLSGLLIAPRPK